MAGITAHQLAFIHDELQFETTPINVNSLQHPWYLALHEQESTTNSESKSKQKQKLEQLGPTFIKYKDPHELTWAAGLFEGEGLADLRLAKISG